MKRIAIYLIMIVALMACSSDDSNDDPVNIKEYIVVDEIVKLNGQEEYSLTVKANCKWFATTDVDWITIDPASGENKGKITLKGGPNKTDGERRATVTFKNEKNTVEQYLTVIQPKSNDESFVPESGDNPLPN